MQLDKSPISRTKKSKLPMQIDKNSPISRTNKAKPPSNKVNPIEAVGTKTNEIDVLTT